MIQYIRNFEGGFMRIHGYDMESRSWKVFIVSVALRTRVAGSNTRIQVMDIIGGKYILQPRGCDICYQVSIGDILASDRGFRYASFPKDAPMITRTWEYEGPSPIIGYPKTTALEFDGKGSCKVVPLGS